MRYQNLEVDSQLDIDTQRILFENRAVLEGLAKNDGDEYVRETACHYLLQTAEHDGRLQALLSERLLEDESAIVRKYILQAAIRKFPLLDRPTLELLYSDRNEEIRLAAFGLLSQFNYGWTLQGLSIESSLQLVYDTFFKWVLWKTGYERRETAERMAEGLGITQLFSQKLDAISKQIPDVDIFERAAWFRRTVEPDSRGKKLEKRKKALVSRLRKLEVEPGIDFLTEIFVGWASGLPNSKEVVFELGKRMYYVV